MNVKRPKTEVIIAIIGLVGVLGAAVITNWDRIFPPKPKPVPPANTNSSPPINASKGQPTQSNTENCLTMFLETVPKDRVAVLEDGANDVRVISSGQSKEQTFALRLEKNRQPLGAIKLQFYANGEIFKIEDIIDSQCRKVDDFENEWPKNDKHVMPNYSNLIIRFSDGTFMLNLDFGSGRIDADFKSIAR